MKKFSISTAVGFGIAIFCVIFSIYGAGHLSSFWNLPSVFITVGGTMGSVVISFPPAQLKNLGRVIMRSFKKDKYDLEKDIETIVGLSEIARSKGILALEEVGGQYINDEFLHKGIMLIADGAGEEQLKASLHAEMHFMQKRHSIGHAMLDMIGDTVTSLGLLGTYIGLIPMLENLDDPTKLGPMMAIELVTSFYGAFIAYVVFLPMSKRLKTMSKDERLRQEVLTVGFLEIQKGESPRIIQEELLSCLTKRQVGKMKKNQNRLRELKIKGAA